MEGALKPLAGALLGATLVLVTLAEWGAGGWAGIAAEAATVAAVAVLAVQVRWTRQVFVAVGLGLLAVAAATRADWREITDAALGTAAFIAAFFAALATLRFASGSSPAIERCGHFLARQPPGRRYLALTVGGQLFALLLNYGALVLLGSLAEADAREETNPEIRRHRLRRMLLAIQRGFVSTLPWSPLAFAVAITTQLVPGASWADAVGPCLVSGLILAGTGWALDTIFKPRIAGPRPPRKVPEGGWLGLWPLITLLAILAVAVGVLHFGAGVRIVGVVMLVVPLLSLGWVALQSRGATAGRVRRYFAEDLPSYRGEIVLLIMAGFIGTLGARLAVPWVEAAGLDLAALPAWAVLVALVWIVPLTGQLGMNPILSVSLIAPILPEAAAWGLEPSHLIVALTAGWAVSGANSPYTATTLLIGAIGGVSAREVGLGWNGLYSVVICVILSAWVFLYTLL